MTKILNKYIGNTYLHPRYKKVEVMKQIPGSRTKLEVKIVDRGPGYDETKKKYTGVRFKSGWCRGQNYAHGELKIIHYKELKPISSEISPTT
jgi:hypothetical protein